MRAWLTARGLPWIDDPTNESDRFLRVRTRKALVQLAPLGLTVERLAGQRPHLAMAQGVVRRRGRGRRSRHLRGGGGASPGPRRLCRPAGRDRPPPADGHGPLDLGADYPAARAEVGLAGPGAAPCHLGGRGSRQVAGCRFAKAGGWRGGAAGPRLGWALAGGGGAGRNPGVGRGWPAPMPRLARPWPVPAGAGGDARYLAGRQPDRRTLRRFWRSHGVLRTRFPRFSVIALNMPRR
ncbi:MAG: hypothetical protein IPL38_11760 [Rhodobacter sp.]|nr:hypothetical protein [Rhodobacter sp.]